jgi:polyferredoxin
MPARYVQPLRILIQFCFLSFMVWLGLRLYLFVQYFRSGGATAPVARPDGVEGFLPISGLLGLAGWLKGLGINPIHPAAVVIFLTAVAVSLLLRRSFCSWICPVATISECAWKAGFRGFRRNFRLPHAQDLAGRTVKYLILAFFIGPIMFTMPPLALNAFINADDHRLADVHLMDFFLNISPLALGIILALVAASILLNNPFCRYLCPYGALLGLVAKLSPVRVTRDTDRCVSCGACTQACPAHIDVMHEKSVNSAECIGCWRCVSYCRVDGVLSMRVAGRFVISGIVFACLVVSLFWGGSLVGKVTGHWRTVLDAAEYGRLLGR